MKFAFLLANRKLEICSNETKDLIYDQKRYSLSFVDDHFEHL